MDQAPSQNQRLRTAERLGPTKGMAVAKTRLEMRRPGAFGTAHSMVGGHGGKVWWVRHETGEPDDIAPYSLSELEPAPGPTDD